MKIGSSISFQMQGDRMSSKSTLTVLIEKMLPVFCESASQTFETMVYMPIKCGEAVLKNAGLPLGAISGTIGITGEGICGCLSLIFSKKLAQKIFSSMMMMDDDASIEDHELHDAVGELSNMVAGGAKAKLQEEGIDFVIGLPTVVVGEAHHLEPPTKATTYIVPMEVSEETFYMELSVT